jgi:hypothetical protein
MPSELEKVLENWLREAASPRGRLADGVSPAAWVAARVTAWWKERAGIALDDVAGFAARIETELERSGGWKNRNLGDAMEEATHLREAIAQLRTVLELDQEPAPDQAG